MSSNSNELYQAVQEEDLGKTEELLKMGADIEFVNDKEFANKLFNAFSNSDEYKSLDNTIQMELAELVYS